MLANPLSAPPDDAFRLPAAEFEPAYLALYRSGGLAERAEAAVRGLANCRNCPRACGIDRTSGRTGTCRIGRYARVASYGPHFGEEACLRGWAGSGTLFFASCNLRCVFCQNHTLSQRVTGEETEAARLAEIMLSLQAAGCHNLNLVTPEHVVPQILEALVIAVARGLRLPIVYNTSAYDGLDTLRLLDGVVDIYLPDFKIWDPRLAFKYLLARDYPGAARRAIQEMQRQVGPLRLDERGLAKRGVLLRHLVMPGQAADTRAILRFVAGEVSVDTYLNLMAQYQPAHRVSAELFPELNRALLPREYAAAYAAARQVGLYRFDERPTVWN